MHNSASANISSLLHLASNTCTRLKVTFNQRKVSDGVFSIYASKLWNSLPDRLRQLDDCSVFKCDLKTFFFFQYSYLIDNIDCCLPILLSSYCNICDLFVLIWLFLFCIMLSCYYLLVPQLSKSVNFSNHSCQIVITWNL